jgi:hypothetical protein
MGWRLEKQCKKVTRVEKLQNPLMTNAGCARESGHLTSHMANVDMILET